MCGFACQGQTGWRVIGPTIRFAMEKDKRWGAEVSLRRRELRMGNCYGSVSPGSMSINLGFRGRAAQATRTEMK